MGKMAVGSVAGSLAGGVSSIIGGFTDMIGFGGGDVAGEDTGATSSDIKKLRDDFEPRQKKGEVSEEQTAEYSQAMDALADESIKGNNRIRALN